MKPGGQGDPVLPGVCQSLSSPELQANCARLVQICNDQNFVSDNAGWTDFTLPLPTGAGVADPTVSNFDECLQAAHDIPENYGVVSQEVVDAYVKRFQNNLTLPVPITASIFDDATPHSAVIHMNGQHTDAAYVEFDRADHSRLVCTVKGLDDHADLNTITAVDGCFSYQPQSPKKRTPVASTDADIEGLKRNVKKFAEAAIKPEIERLKATVAPRIAGGEEPNAVVFSLLHLAGRCGLAQPFAPINSTNTAEWRKKFTDHKACPVAEMQMNQGQLSLSVAAGLAVANDFPLAKLLKIHNNPTLQDAVISFGAITVAMIDAPMYRSLVEVVPIYRDFKPFGF